MHCSFGVVLRGRKIVETKSTMSKEIKKGLSLFLLTVRSYHQITTEMEMRTVKSTLRHTVWTVYLDKRRPVRRPAVHRACLFPAVDHSSRSCCRRDWDVYHWYFATRGDPGKDLSSMWKVVATERIQIGQCCAKSKSSSCLLTGTCSVQWLSAASEQLFFSAHARFGEGVLNI